MIFRDQFQYAFGNLRKTRLRTTLTAAGVAIGVGAMTSMVSVGSGTQRNVLRAINEQYVLTSVMVRPPELTGDSARDSVPPLDARAVAAIERIEGVREAFPLLAVPGLLVWEDERLFQSLEGMPAWLLQEQIERGRIELVAGRAYEEGEAEALVLSERAARRLIGDSVAPDTLLGRTLSFVVAQVSRDSGASHASSLPSRLLERSPVGRFMPRRLALTVVGIVKGAGTFGDFVGVSLWVPLERVEPLHSSAFQDLASVLTGEVRAGGYPLLHVITSSMMHVRGVQDSVEAMGYRTESVLDEIAEVRRAFVIMNGLLAMIGGVSLTVAAMMIVNTLVMAVLERTSEIGLLKSLGATDADVMRLFLTEAGVIGLLGGVGGLVLGYAVARITNAIANFQFQRVGEVSVDLVAFTPWLMAGGMGFALLVSLLAGLYPARRAARVDPVVALRHY
ncbi:MAG: ABC transporter permease [Gemmatimonadales bacterium]